MGSENKLPKKQRHIALLSGGVGGARLARGLAAVNEHLTVIVNVGDDESIYGLHVSADIDTVLYTLAGIEGPAGWGIENDTFAVLDALSAQGVDTTFRLGDRDLAGCLSRTLALGHGIPLSEITRSTAKQLGISANVLPATDDPLRTLVRTADDEWLRFQDYFVLRQHRDPVAELRFDGATDASPTPGVLQAITDADIVIIGPSNPPLSIWPILAVPGVREAVKKKAVTAVSPLIGGKAVKGPAAEVLASLGLPPGSAGVVAAYEGLVGTLVVDTSDAGDTIAGVRVQVADTRIADLEAATRLAEQL